ncbi:LysR family transcriptional regulator [Streptomyces poonensis]|uniref:LysR family transcriptional regulator n=1 Tax=Streptomyces poonensis TaxID=68255 RepID=UPI00227D8963|nr:LysR family transcriptional regulator [Streptomyces poonensis]
MQISRLRTLIAVVETGGFRRAAEALHVTQPAVSQQIRQLSSLVEGPIFTGTGRRMRLSPQGEELLGYARRIVALNDDVIRRFVPQPGSVRLAIGVADQLAESLPEILRFVIRNVPHARVSVRTGVSEFLAPQVASGQLDLALLLQPCPPQSAAANRELGHLCLGWFGQPAHGEGAPLPLSLATEPCTLRNRILEALDASHVSWRISYEGAELVGLRAAAKAGLGVACLLDNGDGLWGLPRAIKPSLPPPPGPLPVTLVASNGVAARSGLLSAAERACRQALRGYPFAD